MKALITGSTGMIGRHFVAQLRAMGYSVVGIARPSAASRLNETCDYTMRRCDILERDGLVRIFREERPDMIVHLAAQAFNGLSWEMEETTYHANVLGTANVLLAAKKECLTAKVLLACSSAEYGDVKPTDCPLREDRLLRPITPYGVTKVAVESMGYQYYCNFGMRVFLPRLFIHVGTGHPSATAIQNFARQLAMISKGRCPPILKVGRLDTARDVIDARDGVRAMLLLLEKGNPGEPMNICNGVAVRVDEMLEMLIEISGVKVEVVQSSDLLRPSDEPLLLGDNSKLTKLGWKRNYTLEGTLREVYGDWLGRV